MDYGENFNIKDIKYFCEFDLVWKIEEWRDIPDYEGHYQVSDLGRVKSFKCWHGNGIKILKYRIGKRGYKYVTLLFNANKNTFKIHQLVAIAFLNHIPCGYELVINHKDLIKLHNMKWNLEIVTPRENSNKKHLKSSSKHTGVCWNKENNNWRASIEVKGKNVNLGSFKNEDEAGLYYINAVSALLNGSPIVVKKPVKSSKYKGVHFDTKKNKYISKITINGKSKHIGYFTDELEAHNAYQKALSEIK